MPRTLRGSASWPGISGSDIECTYTCSHGITPGRAVLLIPPTNLDQIAETGDLILSDGRQKIPLLDCHVSEPHFRGGGGEPPTATLVIDDHRWRWRFGKISGRYNILEERYFPIPTVGEWFDPTNNAPTPPPNEPAGEEPIREDTKKDSQELAKLCLEAMGERGYDVSVLDAQKYPSVNWDGILPADALQQLAEDQGCRVVWQPVQNRVLIATLGEGDDLPGGALVTDAPGVDVKARPAKLGLLGMRKRYEVLLKVNAVGLDFDGKLYDIDDLSFKPQTHNGWQDTSPPYFPNLPDKGKLPGQYTQQDAVKLAQQCVYRMYRVSVEDPWDSRKPLLIPPDCKEGERLREGPGKIKDVRQLNLLDHRLLVASDDKAQPTLFPATCFGRHSPPVAMKDGTNVLSLYEQTDTGTEVKVPFDVDARHQLIKFHDYVYAWRGGKAYEAGLTLLTAVEVYDPDDFQYLRYYHELPVQDGLDAKPAVIVREDVRYEEVAIYDLKNAKFLKVVTNEKHVRPRAEYYLFGESLRYVAAQVGQRSYPGLLPLDPDGKIQQVTWSVGGGRESNPSTVASSNSEHQLHLPSYRERRQLETTDIDAWRRNRAEVEEKYGVNSTQG